MCRKTEPPEESPILTSARVARVVLAKWVTSDASPVSASVRDTRSRVGHTGDRSVEVHPALGAVGAIPDNGRTGQLWILLPTLMVGWIATTDTISGRPPSGLWLSTASQMFVWIDGALALRRSEIHSTTMSCEPDRSACLMTAHAMSVTVRWLCRLMVG